MKTNAYTVVQEKDRKDEHMDGTRLISAPQNIFPTLAELLKNKPKEEEKLNTQKELYKMLYAGSLEKRDQKQIEDNKMLFWKKEISLLDEFAEIFAVVELERIFLLEHPFGKGIEYCSKDRISFNKMERILQERSDLRRKIGTIIEDEKKVEHTWFMLLQAITNSRKISAKGLVIDGGEVYKAVKYKK